MVKTIKVSDAEVEASKPNWLNQYDASHSIHKLYASSLEWRLEMHRATTDEESQDRIGVFSVEWDIARNTITLSEAERRWQKTNLRQNPIDQPFRWQSGDGRGTWLTTTYAMEKVFGVEPQPAD